LSSRCAGRRKIAISLIDFVKGEQNGAGLREGLLSAITILFFCPVSVLLSEGVCHL
jgi:hypothetical protein